MKTILAMGLYLLLGFVFCFSMDSQKLMVLSPTAEELANNQTELMHQVLSLTSEQKEKVGEINLKYAKQLAETKTPDLTKSYSDKMVELGEVFTVEQSKKWMERRKYLLSLAKDSSSEFELNPDENIQLD